MNRRSSWAYGLWIVWLFAGMGVAFGQCITDVNGDGAVTEADFWLVVDAWPASSGAIGYDSARDFDGNGRIDALDLAWVLTDMNSPECQASGICVDGSNLTGTEDGTACYPFVAVQAAIDAANAGDMIRIAEGEYDESIVVSDKSLMIKGGFPGGTVQDYATGICGDFSASAPDLHESVLHGDAAGPVVFFVHNGASGSRLENLTIRGGQRGVVLDDDVTWPPLNHMTLVGNVIEANGVEDTGLVGGGLLLPGDQITLQGNVIRNNVGGRGAGLAAFGEELVLQGNVIEGNVAHGDHGGGAYIAGTVTLTGNVVRSNRVGETDGYGWGGGWIVFGDSSATMSGNLITHNFAPSLGGGVFIDDEAEAWMYHEIIAHNETSDDSIGGAAVYVDGLNQNGSTAWIEHCTIAYNQSLGDDGNAVFVEGNSLVVIKNTICWGNGGDDFHLVDAGDSLSMTYSLSEESWPGSGNLHVDPQFADTVGADFHLKSVAGRYDPMTQAWVADSVNSPAIDAGDPSSAFDREPQPHGARTNLGAHGNTAEASKSGS